MVVWIVVGVVVLALIGLTVFYFIQKKKKKEAEQAAEFGEPAGPGGDEVSVVIHEAEKKLAQSKVHKGGKLANHPVFLLLGDSGATKTTVMQRSGIDAELLAGQVFQNSDIIPTRTANLWFLRRNIFVEAGGSLLADSAKWGTLVKRLLPKASIVGKGEQAARAAVVFFDCDQFTKPGASDLIAQAGRNLRARLGQVSQVMGINLPVYVMFAKVDRLPYFTDFVRNLSNDEANQVFGVTLPMVSGRSEGVYAEQEAARLTYSFEALFRSLADTRPEFLGRETDASKLPGTYEFPREFRKLRTLLVQFLVDLCRPSQLSVGPFLRGFYFTGVRPVVINEAAPIMAAPQQQQQASQEPAAGATSIFRMGADPAAAAPPPAARAMTTRKVPQWVFLPRLFNEIFLADRSAMGASGASTRTSTGRRVLFIAAASLCFLCSIFFTISFFKNRSLVNNVRDAAKGISTTPIAAADLAPVAELKKLETLRIALEDLSRFHREGAPFLYHWGLYAGEDVYHEARPLYFARFRQLLLGPTQNTIVPMLADLPPKPPGPEYNDTYNALKAYLITTSNHDKSDRQWLTPVLMKWWANGRTVDPERTPLAEKQFDFYAGELQQENPFSSSNNGPAVEQARRYLKQFEGSEHVYAVMLAAAGKANPNINFNKQFPNYVKIVSDPYEVKGAFSKGGWDFMRDNIPHADRYFTGEEWVLGKQTSGNLNPDTLKQTIHDRYLADFEKEWRAYLRAAEVQKYGQIPDAAQRLQVISGPQSPLLAALCLASENTVVDDPKIAGIFTPPHAVVPAPCLAKYVQQTNQNYMDKLIDLQGKLESLGDKPPSADSAAPSLASADAARTATKQLTNTFGTSDVALGAKNDLLLQPITIAEGLLKGAGPAELNAGGKGMCNDMKGVLAKFPFNPAAKTDVTIQELNSFLAPADGALWKFWDKSLQKYVTRDGAEVAGATIKITPAFAFFLSRAWAFTQAVYPNNAANPKLPYKMRWVADPEYEKLTLALDGQSAEFSADTPAKDFVWTGSGDGFKDLAEKAKGGDPYHFAVEANPWGIFHFVHDADRQTGNITELFSKSGAANTHLKLPSGKDVSVKLEITASPQVFDKSYFGSLKCVPDVAKQ